MRILYTTFLLCILTSVSLAQGTYRLTDLGDLPGGPDFSVAFALNDIGQIVGQGQTTGNSRSRNHGFLWEDGVLTDLDGFGTAYDISNEGVIVGNSVQLTAEEAPVTALSLSNGDTLELVATDWFDVAFGINEQEQVVGYSQEPGSGFP